MQTNRDKQIGGRNESFGEIFTDEATKLKIHKHLNDINDTITDEDIRNIRLFDPAVNLSNNRNTIETGKNAKNYLAWNIG
ncbi:MAG TPA: hypothetical protein VK498_03635 [Ferruginibacter sp.]|nr:hypothetical protein [Ferruginibacter sp.]